MNRLLVLFFVAFAFGSCLSSKNDLAEREFSTENSRQHEISQIRKSFSNRPVEAFWRAAILKNVAEDSEGVSQVYDDALANVVEFYEKSVEKAEYKNALNAAQSLEAAKINSPKTANFRKALPPLLPKHSLEQNSVQKKIGEAVKGTVTVLVDQGLKIERGRAFVSQVLGSGFFIDKSGYIITNHHVISSSVDPKFEGVSRVYVKLSEDSETKIPAKVVGWDDFLDLALLKVEVDAPYVFSLGEGGEVSQGDGVFVIGSPVGLENTITSGIVSSLDRSLFPMGPVYQIDAAVNGGNSGGPLVGQNGRVVGVVFAGAPDFQGLNFAIPVEYLRAVLPSLFAGGRVKHGWFGSFGKTFRQNSEFGVQSGGVEIFYVMPGSPAFRAGLRANSVLTAINGEKIKNLDDLQFFLMRCEAERIFSITASPLQNGKMLPPQDFLAYFDSRPKQPGYEIYSHDTLGNSMLPIFGMELSSTSTFFSKKFAITRIIKSSIADQSGFSPLDPLEICKVTFSDEKDIMFVELATKKQKSGYLDIFITLGASLDGNSFF